MKSNDFVVNEGLVGSALGALGNVALNKLTNTNSSEQRRFLKLFSDRFNTQLKLNPQLNINDFLDLYWKKNNYDVSSLPASYKNSLDSASQLVANDPSSSNLTQLGNVVYSIAAMLHGSVSNTNQSTNTTTKKTLGNNQIDTETNQIIAKIRSMQNTPEEVDDLIDILAISMFKLYKIAPKNYKQIMMSLLNNGGRPSMPSATQTSQPVQTGSVSSQQGTPVSQQNTSSGLTP